MLFPAIVRAGLHVLVLSLAPLVLALDAKRTEALPGTSAREESSEVHGRVEWPDGRSAVGAQVDWYTQDGNPLLGFDLFGNSSKNLTAKDGSFTLSNVNGTLGRVVVRATKKEDSSAWFSIADSVKVGASPIVLKLRPCSRLRGHVVDDRGEVVRSCRVTAVQTIRTNDGRSSSTIAALASSVDDPKGLFVLDGLLEGAWDVQAVGTDGAMSAVVRVVAPSEKPLELRVLRLAAVSGIVLDPDGRAVGGATVHYPSKRPGVLASLSDQDTFVTCDSNGKFSVEGAPPGVLFLSARGPGWAPSEKQTLTLQPGESRAELALSLRVGGTISGEVVDASDHPCPNRTVRASEQDNFDLLDDWSAITDSQGHFEIRGLPPGMFSVRAYLSDSPMDLVKPDKVVVEVVPANTVHVILGKAVPLPIHVGGVVRMNSAPMSGLRVRATKVYNNPTFESREATSDEQGRFEISFPRPGTHWWEFKLGQLAHVCRRYVSEDARQDLDFEFSSGSLRGRVLGLDGKPCPGLTVDVETGRSSTSISAFHVSGSVRTDEQGRFVFEPLFPASYRIMIGGAGEAMFDRAQPYGIVVREDLLVEAAKTHEVEIQLSPSCSVAGTVLGEDGKPCTDVVVLGRDEHGVFFEDGPLARTNAEGRFRIDGLPPGRASFFARTLSLGSEESLPLELSPKKTPQVELTLKPCTRLWVDAGDGQGVRLSRYQVRILDARDNDVAIQFWDEEPDDELEGSLQAVLTPGKYMLLIRHEDGSHARVEFETSGKPCLRIERRLER